MNHDPMSFLAKARADLEQLTKNPPTTLNEALGRFFGYQRDETMTHIPIAETIGCVSNWDPFLGHKKCGCPGNSPMVPTQDEDWICTGCNGYVTKEEADPVLQKGLAEFESMFGTAAEMEAHRREQQLKKSLTKKCYDALAALPMNKIKWDTKFHYNTRRALYIRNLVEEDDFGNVTRRDKA